MSEHNIEKDEISGQTTTGHEWDGIKELNTPLPKWWLYSFYVSIVWAIGYMIVYPAIPFFGENGYSEGVLQHSDRDNVAADIIDAKNDQKVYLDQIAATELTDISKNEELLAFAARGGQAAFGDNCAPCHGSAAQGFKGFPNLQDDDWLWGGRLEDIHYTLQHGIRWEDDAETRFSEMPRFLDDGILDRAAVLDVTEFVLSLSGDSEHADRVERGAAIYADNCAVCHSDTGVGDRLQGAPNLTDSIWLFGGDRQSIYDTIAHSRRGVMPAWAGRLDDVTIKQLAIYVHGLGGGEAAAETEDQAR